MYHVTGCLQISIVCQYFSPANIKFTDIYEHPIFERHTTHHRHTTSTAITTTATNANSTMGMATNAIKLDDKKTARVKKNTS